MAANATSEYYLGEKGKSYFEWQSRTGEMSGRLNARKFAPHVRPTDRVLDFGCGSGSLLRHLDCAYRIGVEINPTALQFAVSQGLDEGHTVLDSVPDNHVDLIVSNHALEHVPAPLDVLRELHRVLRPGGRFVMYLPINDWRNDRRYDPTDINHHLYTWTLLLIGHLLSEAEFKVSEARVVTHAWPPKVAWFERALPRPVFDAVCVVSSILRRQRQVMAVATK